MISPKYTSGSPVKWNSISEVDCQRWLFCSSLTGNKLFLSSSASKQLLFEGMPGIPSIWLFSHSSGNADWMSCIVLGSGDPVVKAKLNADPCETHILIRWRHDKLQKYMDWWVLDKTRKTPPGQIKKSPISSWKKGLHHLPSVVCCRQWRSQSHPPLSQRHLSLVMRMSCHQDRVRDQLAEWKAWRLWNYVRTGNWGDNGRALDGKRPKNLRTKSNCQWLPHLRAHGKCGLLCPPLTRREVTILIWTRPSATPVHTYIQGPTHKAPAD